MAAFSKSATVLTRSVNPFPGTKKGIILELDPGSEERPFLCHVSGFIFFWKSRRPTHKMNKESFNPENFVKRLSTGERAGLLQALLGAHSDILTGRQMAAQLMEAERWFWNLAREKTAFSYSRGRMWLIFMLLRYGALRLQEIFSLTDEDCNFREGLLRAGKRIVPFSPDIANLLNNFWLSWPGRNRGRYPLQCDSSLVRHSFAQCAKKCRLDVSLLNARSLRRLRGLELECEGLHPAIVNWFLGKNAEPLPFSPRTAQALLTRHIKMEQKMKTSARNVFRGQITKLEQNGILVSVTLETAQGLPVTSIITATSCENLGLAPGVSVNALVKAPWVTVFPENERAMAGSENCYSGTVESISRDALACEINALLPQGNRICALYANGASPSGEISEGSRILICFSAFAVILTAD